MTDSYSDIGALFARARREFSLSVEDVGRLLHIRTRYIEAMEEGRFSDLPGIIYTKGYLQSYAAFLGLDKDELLRRFEEVEKTMSKRGFYLPGGFSGEKAPSPVIIWGAAGTALFLYLLWLLVIRPPMPQLSVVEQFPQPQETVMISADLVAEVACLGKQIVYYPPCTGMAEDFSLLPLPAQITTIMQLGIPSGDKAGGNNDSDTSADDSDSGNDNTDNTDNSDSNDDN